MAWSGQPVTAVSTNTFEKCVITFQRHVLMALLPNCNISHALKNVHAKNEMCEHTSQTHIKYFSFKIDLTINHRNTFDLPFPTSFVRLLACIGHNLYQMVGCPSVDGSEI